MIYLILNSENNTVKIGFSETPMIRLKNIQTGCPHTLDLIACKFGTMDHEKELHKKFDQFRLTGEWFIFDNSIKEYFELYSLKELKFIKTDDCYEIENDPGTLFDKFTLENIYDYYDNMNHVKFNILTISSILNSLIKSGKIFVIKGRKEKRIISKYFKSIKIEFPFIKNPLETGFLQ